MAERAAGLLLTARECDLLAILARAGAARLEQRNGASLPPRVTALLADLERFARTSRSAGQRPGPNIANLPDDGDLASSGTRIGVTAAAALARCSPQHVRRLCRRGDLSAARGPDGQWEIDEWSAAAHARQRKDAACLHVSDSPSG